MQRFIRRLAGAAAVTLAATAANAQPVNDECSNAIAVDVAGGTIPVDFTGAQTGDQGPSCVTDRRTIWYKYTAPSSGRIDVTTCFSNTLLAVSLWADCSTELACNAHSDSCPGDGLSALYDFQMVAGQTVLIGVSEYPYYTGQGYLNVFPHFGPPPPNDTCAGATPVTNGTYAVDTDTATMQSPFSCSGGYQGSGDVWYRYTASCTGFATAAFDVGTLKGVLIEALESCNGPVLACHNASQNGGQNVTFPVTAGGQYYVRVSGYANGQPSNGDGTITFTCNPPAANDTCATAQVVGLGGTSFDTRFAATDWPAPDCVESDQGDVFFKYTPTQDTMVFATVGYGNPTDSGYNGSLSVYDSCGGPAIKCDDVDLNDMPEIDFLAKAGHTYIIRAASTLWRGTGSLFMKAEALPAPNDECSGAKPIGLGTTTFDTNRFTAGAYTSEDAVYCFGDGFPGGESLFNNDLWFSFTAPRTGQLWLATGSQNFVAEVYDGCGGNWLACTQIFTVLQDGRDSMATCFQVDAGQTYIIRVGQDFFTGGGVSDLILEYLDTTSYSAPEGAIEESEACGGPESNAGCAWDPDNPIMEHAEVCSAYSGTLWNDWDLGWSDYDMYEIQLEAGVNYVFEGQTEVRASLFVGTQETCYHALEEEAIIQTDGNCKNNFEDHFTATQSGTHYIYVILGNGETACGDANRYWFRVKQAGGGCPGECISDFDGSGFTDTDDFDAFVHAFELGGEDADVDGSGFTDTDDFDFFVHRFEEGC